MNIPDSRVASDSVAASNNGDALFSKTVGDSISTSVGTKTNTATISTSGKVGQDVINTIHELKQKGYKVSVSGTNLTVTW